MSSSVFKIFPSSSQDSYQEEPAPSSGGHSEPNAVDEHLRIDSNLVILVNKDGSVAVDHNTLESLLANETTDTSVSVVRFSSPTPSIEEEIEEERRLLKEQRLQQEMDGSGGSVTGGSVDSNEDSTEASTSATGTSSGSGTTVPVPVASGGSGTGATVATRRSRTSRKEDGDDEGETPHVSLTVEGYYPPHEARQFAAQVLSLTGYQNPLRLEAIDVEFHKYIIANDHCYTPLTSPTQKLPPRTNTDDLDSADDAAAVEQRKPATTIASGRRKSVVAKATVAAVTPTVSKTSSRRKSVMEKRPLPVKRSESPESAPEDSESDYVEDSSFSEEDDNESDVDFSIGTKSSRKRKNSKIKSPPVKAPTRPQRRSETVEEVPEAKKEQRKLTAKVVPHKNPVVAKLPSSPSSRLVIVRNGEPVMKTFAAKKISPVASGSSKQPVVLTVVNTPTKPEPPTPVAAVPTTPVTPASSVASVTPLSPTTPVVPSSTVNPALVVQKREKKPKSSLHTNALFSDMTSLFSTPDIIKKVGGNKSLVTAIAAPATSSNNTPSAKGFVQLTPASAGKGVPKLSSQILMQSTVVEERRLDTGEPVQHTELGPLVNVPGQMQQTAQLLPQQLPGLLPEVPQQMHPCPLPGSEEIPNIMNMLEPAGGVDGALANSLLATVKPGEVEPVLPLIDNSILEELHSKELRQQVVELLSHKQIQEVLDKEALVMDVGSTLLADMPVNPLLESHVPIEQPPLQLPPHMTPQPSFSQDPPMVTQTNEALPTMTVKEQQMPRKEAIQIQRSDGRVIILPPIEAPATRSAKRRAQAGSLTPVQQQSPAQTAQLATVDATSQPKDSVVASPMVPAIATVASHGTPKTPPVRAVKHVVSTPITVTPISGVVSYDDGAGSLVIDETRGNKSAAGIAAAAAAAIAATTTASATFGKSNRMSTESARNKRQSTTSVAAVVAAEVAAQDDDIDSDESWNSEDDPDRLWCICKQPHNNRFMICCDSCEDWFHGKCVNITKAMGQQMEQDGIEWTCPNCLKKKQDRQQPKMTDFLQATIPAAPLQATPKPTVSAPKVEVVKPPPPAISGCMVCSKPARANSIYCSDECIRKHAQTAQTPPPAPVAAKEKPKERVVPVAAPVPSTPQRAAPVPTPPTTPTTPTDKLGPIIVMERKTGRCLTGKNAPTAENLKSWLQLHPTFELVPPGSPQASIILAKQAEVRKQQAKDFAQKKATAVNQTPKVQSQLKVNDQKKVVLVTQPPPSRSPSHQHAKQSQPKVQQTQPAVTKVTAPVKQLQKTGSNSSPSMATTVKVAVASTPAKGVVKGAGSSSGGPMATSTPTSSAHGTSASQKSRKTTTTPSTDFKQQQQQQQKPQDEPKPSGSKASNTTGGENIRDTVKKTLKEHLMQRTAELTDNSITRLTEEEIDKFVSSTEVEMFALFNKDIGMKYRSKYRSLMFNIKDRKNLSLFQKICSKSIEPKQLVRMTPEELASQELAQWRENETKHQLEMIKKSELDLLACAKNYVLKTHKGEEVIEGKRNERLELDPSTSVEDVVTVLNNSAVSSTSEPSASFGMSKDSSYRGKDYDFGYGKHYSGLYGSASISSSSPVTGGATAVPSADVVSAATSSSSVSSGKKKESRRSRSRSRSGGRKRNREKSRDRSRSKHKRKRSRGRSHERHGSRDRDRHTREHKSELRNRERSRERKREKKDSKNAEHSSGKPKEVAVPLAETPATTIPESPVVESGDSKDKNEAVGKSVEAKKTAKGAEQQDTVSMIDLTVETAASKGPESSKSPMAPPATEDVIVAESKEQKTAGSSSEQDQEPTSTVTIPTPPHSAFGNESPDYAGLPEDLRRRAEFVYWTGNVHMVDVASVEMSMRAVSGDIEDLTKDFTEDLDICGTIKPEIVLDYIGQIKKSLTKEVCMVRFHSSDTSAYYALYSHLFTRERYSVLKSPSSSVKDFYIMPLPAEQMVPMILKPFRGIGIVEGDRKPNLLLGLIVKIKNKRPATGGVSGVFAPTEPKARRHVKPATASNSKAAPVASGISPTVAMMQQVITKYATRQPTKSVTTGDGSSAEYTPEDSVAPLATMAAKKSDEDRAITTSPTTLLAASKQRSVDLSNSKDIDMKIIKAPIVSKASSSGGSVALVDESEPMVVDDDNEPYSPGDGSDDSNFADVTAIVATKSTATQRDPETERFQREMEEIDRKIAGKKSEIVGIISKADLKDDELKSTLTPSLITDIALPSNLCEILANVVKTGSVVERPEKVALPVPTPPALTTVTPSVSAFKESHPSASAIPVATVVLDDDDDDEEYIPTAPSLYSSYKASYSSGTAGDPNATGSMDIDERILPMAVALSPFANIPLPQQPAPSSVAAISGAGASGSGESRLAKLSEEELLRMVPDDALLAEPPPKNAHKGQPVATRDTEGSSDESERVLPSKKSKWYDGEPPPPGLEDEYEPL